MTSRILFVVLSILVLTGCTSRQEADALLARGCEAGVEAILPGGFELSEVRDATFTNATQGNDFRHVTLEVVEMDGWLEVEKEYHCIFQESFGFLNANYTASIHQIRTDHKVIGKSGNEILGDTQDFLKLTEAIREAMYQ